MPFPACDCMYNIKSEKWTVWVLKFGEGIVKFHSKGIVSIYTATATVFMQV